VERVDLNALFGQLWPRRRRQSANKISQVLVMGYEAIETKRLIVRRILPHEAARIASYRGHPEVAKFQTAYSLADVEELIQQMSGSDPSVHGKWFQFAIELTAENRLIGDIGFLNHDENEKSWIGFTLDPEYWGRGFATEAVGAVLAYYARLGIFSVWASTDPRNYPSMRLLRNLGFALVDSKPDDVIFVRANPPLSQAQPESVAR
jgi:RimJ/RimL family protein N-acetyltransferase